ncbi:DNA-directed RNA polymerase III subunit rpc3 isoform X2 [Salvia hispanica]|uniref:DNA-directed RNA polymerase III subunit rpc3 isoform X2 n=1 Tax=Salvia hispanica TaxID=49212 RepID=UPI002009AA8A|nr:DNA-directed RNA polymerase III subunit rpc3 isoform X2 [Salvia hispanica]
MVSQHGILLAAHVISSFYGDLCSKVCECLLRKGTLKLDEIGKATQLSRENVFNCLRVLIHQNCVQAFQLEQEGVTAQKSTHYMVLFDNIMHKLRAPKFMQIVSEELGEDVSSFFMCRGILLGLIQHGRLSFDQIIDREKQKTGSSDNQVVHDSFRRLLSARFIERCPLPGPLLTPPTDEAPAKKRGAKSGEITERKTIEQLALEAAALSESIRFSMDTGDISEEKGEESTNIPKVGQKRKNIVMDSDDELADVNRKIEVLWRVNFEEFLWRLIHKACISHVKTSINNEASIVLSAALDLIGQSETRMNAENSPDLSINDIYEEVIKKDGGVGMDLDRVQTSLEQLGCETLATDMESYSIDIKSFIQMAQNQEVESMILKRYGKEAYKIFRLLSRAGRLVETDKISDITFVEKKETTKILFQLWKDGYLHMESMTAARPPSFHLWKVDQKRFREKFLDEMYHAVLNLKLRIAHEQDQRKEVLQIPKDKLVGELRNKVMVYKIVRATLERSLMDLDDAVVLFHHF